MNACLIMELDVGLSFHENTQIIKQMRLIPWTFKNGCTNVPDSWQYWLKYAMLCIPLSENEIICFLACSMLRVSNEKWHVLTFNLHIFLSYPYEHITLIYIFWLSRIKRTLLPSSATLSLANDQFCT